MKNRADNLDAAFLWIQGAAIAVMIINITVLYPTLGTIQAAALSKQIIRVSDRRAEKFLTQLESEQKTQEIPAIAKSNAFLELKKDIQSNAQTIDTVESKIRLALSISSWSVAFLMILALPVKILANRNRRKAASTVVSNSTNELI